MSNMFNNHTRIKSFELFERCFKKRLYAEYPQINNHLIHCSTVEQYLQLENVPKLRNFENYSFFYAYNDTGKDENDNCFIAIIISPEICELLKFTRTEILSAIAHEIGHIIHISNSCLNKASDSWKEIKADEVAYKLGLSRHLISLLEKLIISNLYTEEQNSLLQTRIKYLTRLDSF